jgi:hypothetical protein
MLAHANFDVEIARGSAVAACLALACQTDSIPIVYARGNLDLQRLFATNSALPQTRVARLADDLAAAFATRTRLLNGEEALLHTNLADAIARIASDSFRAGRCAAAVAGFAFAKRGEFDIGFVTEDGLFLIEFKVVAQIGTAEYLAPAATTAAEDVAEHIAEDVAESIGRAESSAAASGQALVPMLIVDRTLLAVCEHFVRFLRLFEFLFGFLIVGIAIGMKLHRQSSIRFLDFGLGRCARHVENFVVVALGHSRQNSADFASRFIQQTLSHSQRKRVAFSKIGARLMNSRAPRSFSQMPST